MPPPPPPSFGPTEPPPPPITRHAQTASYRPSVIASRLSQVLDGKPRFTLLEADRMRLDPQVQLGLRILRAPLWGITPKVSADSAKVQRWIEREFTHIYRRMLPKLLRHFEFGTACGEVTYCQHRGKVHFEDFLEIHPRDAEPQIWDYGRRAGQLSGVLVSNVQNSRGRLFLNQQHGFWLKGDAEYGSWHGRPRLAGAYDPWFEKRGRHGAIDARHLFYQKCAFRGPRIRFPVGFTNMAQPGQSEFYVSNQDIGREIVEKFERGGVLALPSVRLPDGSGFAWEWEDPQSFADVAGLLEYPKQLDREILIGLGIPPELVDAATVGSGYSGRAIPAQMFFTSMDEVAGMLVEAIDRQVIRWLVKLNFGKQGYEIQPNSLAEMVSKDPGKPGPQGGDQPGGPPAPPGGGNGPATVPYQGPNGGMGVKNLKTGKVSYGRGGKLQMSLNRRARRALRDSRPAMSPDKYRKLVLLAMCRAQMDAHKVGDPHAADAHLQALAEMLNDPSRGAKVLRLSWSGTTSRRGNLMAIGEGEHQGQTLYGSRAQAALRSQETGGGEKADDATARGKDAVNKARIARKNALSYKAGPEDFKALAEHLPLLPIHELRATRDALGASFRNTRKRDELVSALLAHVQGLVEKPGQWSGEEGANTKERKEETEPASGMAPAVQAAKQQPATQPAPTTRPVEAATPVPPPPPPPPTKDTPAEKIARDAIGATSPQTATPPVTSPPASSSSTTPPAPKRFAPPPAEVIAKAQKTKKGRRELVRNLRLEITKIADVMAAKVGTRKIVDHLTPEQEKAVGTFSGILTELTTGREYDGPFDLGPISPQRYAGYYRAAVQAMEEFRDLIEKHEAGDKKPVRLSINHAPKGGITIGGETFVGGQFIPASVMEKATTEEKAKLDSPPESSSKPNRAERREKRLADRVSKKKAARAAKRAKTIDGATRYLDERTKVLSEQPGMSPVVAGVSQAAPHYMAAAGAKTRKDLIAATKRTVSEYNKAHKTAAKAAAKDMLSRIANDATPALKGHKIPAAEIRGILAAVRTGLNDAYEGMGVGEDGESAITAVMDGEKKSTVLGKLEYDLLGARHIAHLEDSLADQLGSPLDMDDPDTSNGVYEELQSNWPVPPDLDDPKTTAGDVYAKFQKSGVDVPKPTEGEDPAEYYDRDDVQSALGAAARAIIKPVLEMAWRMAGADPESHERRMQAQRELTEKLRREQAAKKAQ